MSLTIYYQESIISAMVRFVIFISFEFYSYKRSKVNADKQGYHAKNTDKFVRRKVEKANYFISLHSLLTIHSIENGSLPNSH